MLFPESWLRSYVNPDLNTEELAHRLTMAGLEVEETDSVGPAFSGVVVAHIVDVQPHPNADRLRVCQVDDGSGAALQIVCGAPNAAAGLKVPLARVGAELPGGMKIGPVKMRGVASAGMLCSARELGLSEDHAGLLELKGDAPVGTNLRSYLDLDDTVFTPTIEDRLPGSVEAADLCGRFAGRVIRGVNARAETPSWMKERLERAGQRSISALVDISNYVMLELGRPTHVFDIKRIAGGLTVRWAREGETLELLSGQVVDLQPDVGVITAGDVVESMAGIMGGEATSVTLETTDIYLEGAFWWPEAIMGRARRYKFSSEASHRFERGVDFANVTQDLEYMTRLIVDICGGQVGPLDDQVVALPEREPVRMRLERCRRVLGLPLERAEVEDIFSRLGLSFTRSEEHTSELQS